MNIRRVHNKDYAAMARLRRQTIRSVNLADYPKEVVDGWSTTVTAKDLRDSATTCKRWVALDGETIIGFCEHTFECELSRMYVHKDHLRKGVGSRLLKIAEASLRKQGCREIRLESSVTAKDFYRKNGYKIIEKTFCQGNKIEEPIYRMQKKIPSATASCSELS